MLPSRSKFLVKLICWFSFNISIKFLLFTQIYSYQFLIILEINMIQLAASFVIISLTSLQFFLCFQMFLNHFLLVDQKTFLHWSKGCNLLFLLLEANFFVSFFYHLHFQMRKQKVCLLSEHLDQFQNLNIGFSSLLIFLIDVYSS